MDVGIDDSASSSPRRVDAYDDDDVDDDSRSDYVDEFRWDVACWWLGRWIVVVVEWWRNVALLTVEHEHNSKEEEERSKNDVVVPLPLRGVARRT